MGRRTTRPCYSGIYLDQHKIGHRTKNINTSVTGAQPSDFSFTSDPETSQTTCTHCPHTTFRADITITHTCCKATYLFEQLKNAVSSLTAIANKHLQFFEQNKLKCMTKCNDSSNHYIIHSDTVIGEFNQNMILLPIAIDPHGR